MLALFCSSPGRHGASARRLLAGLSSLLGLCCSFRVASAQTEATPLVILIDTGREAMTERLREELEALELQVTVVPEPSSAEPLEDRARAHGAIAAIRVTRSGSGAVEMTIVDRATGKTLSRRLVIATPSDPAAAELVATRTVELFRASLLELKSAHPPRGDVPVPPRIDALAPNPPTEPSASPSALRLAFAVGAGLASNPEFVAAPHVWAAFTATNADRLGLTAQFSASLAPERLSAPEGQVEVLVSEYRLGVVYELGPRSNWMALRLETGALLSRLVVNGSAQPPYVAEREDRLTAGPWLATGLGVELVPQLSAWANASAAYLFPHTVVRVAGRELTSWGRPMLAARAGLEVCWP